jgi:hypothetical protein
MGRFIRKTEKFKTRFYHDVLCIDTSHHGMFSTAWMHHFGHRTSLVDLVHGNLTMYILLTIEFIFILLLAQLLLIYKSAHISKIAPLAQHSVLGIFLSPMCHWLPILATYLIIASKL